MQRSVGDAYIDNAQCGARHLVGRWKEGAQDTQTSDLEPRPYQRANRACGVCLFSSHGLNHQEPCKVAGQQGHTGAQQRAMHILTEASRAWEKRARQPQGLTFPSHSDWLKGGHSSEPSGVRHSACPVANPPVKPPLKEKLLENEVNPEDIGLETGVQTVPGDLWEHAEPALPVSALHTNQCIGLPSLAKITLKESRAT